MIDVSPPTRKFLTLPKTHTLSPQILMLLRIMTDDTSIGAAEILNSDHDLLQKLIPHLDRHLVFPLLEFISSHESEAVEEIIQAKYELLEQTNMTDYVAALWQQLHPNDEVAQEFVRKREDVLRRLQLYTEESSRITDLLENPEVVNNLRSDKLANLQFLKDQHGV